MWVPKLRANAALCVKPSYCADSLLQEKHVSVNGVIQKMEFLNPSPDDEDHVILVLVVTSEEKTSFLLYEWDCSRSLRAVGPPKTHPVPPALRCPLLLIPFTIITGFVLVCESSISVYHDILTGDMRCAYIKTPQHLDESIPKEPGNSRRFPLWTAWARPRRRAEYASENDVFYLCKEDGTVQFLEFNISSIPGSAFHWTGDLHVNVDTAFAALDLEWEGLPPLANPSSDNRTGSDDILIVGGDMSDGKVVRMAARKNAEPQQAIPNWTPMVDLCIAKSIPDGIVQAASRRPEVHPLSARRERIFGCVGRGRNHGAVCEMRSGIEARSRLHCEIDDGVTGMWILPDISGTSSGTCLLLTYLDNTTAIIRIANDDSGDIDILSEPDEVSGIETDSRTFAAGSTSTGAIVQVTARSLRTFAPGHAVPIVRRFENERVILACIRSEAILVATDRNGELCLQYGEIQVSNGQLSMDWADEPFILDEEASCLSLQAVDGREYALVGDADGKLHVLIASSTDGLTEELIYDLEGEFAICESVTLLREESQLGSGGRYLFLCGLRNGSLQTFLFEPGKCYSAPTTSPHSDRRTDNAKISHCETLRFGQTSVSVLPDNFSRDPSANICSRAIVLCGGNFSRLTFRLFADGSNHTSIQSIWLTGVNNAGTNHLSIIAQSDPWSVDGGDQSKLLYCIGADQLYGTELVSSLRPYAVVRQMRVPGTPNKIMFSNHLQKLVVACTTIRIRDGSTANGHMRDRNKRLLYPTLLFLDPDEGSIDINKDLRIRPELHDETAREGHMLPGRTPRIIGSSGMRILGLLEWKAKLAGRSFLLLVINSIRPRDEGNRVTGIINLYTVTMNPLAGEVAMKSSGVIKCEHPVYSVAQYNESSLVYTAGDTLNLTALDIVDGTPRLTHRMRWDRLKSEGISVSVRKPYIYVTTAKHSVSAFAIDGNAFKPLFTDENGARQGVHHISLSTLPMVLASDRDGVVAGLWQPAHARMSNSFRTVFEAVFPAPIRKLHLGHVRAPWSAQTEVVEETMIGSCLDGSMYQFELVDEAKWRLLRFLQNLCERNRMICPYMHPKRHRQRLEPLVPTKRDMHIDGDILWRLIERGRSDSGELIRAMLEEEPHEDASRRTDEFDTWEERCVKFSEIVANAALGGGSGEDDAVDAAVGFLRTTLQPIL